MMSLNEPFALLLDTLITLEASSDAFLELTVSAKENEATKKTLSYWKDLFDKNLKNNLKKLDDCLEDQSKFNQTNPSTAKTIELILCL